MTLHPIIKTIKRAAPEWAGWLVKVGQGSYYWQVERGEADNIWFTVKRCCIIKNTRSVDGPFAIDLTTGAIHLQSDGGTITVVSQDEWSAEGDDD